MLSIWNNTRTGSALDLVYGMALKLPMCYTVIMVSMTESNIILEIQSDLFNCKLHNWKIW